MRKQTFHTFDGFVFPSQAPSVRSVAVGLMRETRYCGQSQRWWNVGLHSFVVCDMLPARLKFHGLVHDEPECVTGDIPHDLKTRKQRILEAELLERFYKQNGVKPPTKEEHAIVKKADGLAVNAECWAHAGTECLKTIYTYDKSKRLVEHYLELYSYADCLDVNGKAVREYVRRFELYKTYLKR